MEALRDAARWVDQRLDDLNNHLEQRERQEAGQSLIDHALEGITTFIPNVFSPSEDRVADAIVRRAEALRIDGLSPGDRLDAAIGLLMFDPQTRSQVEGFRLSPDEIAAKVIARRNGEAI